DAGVSPRTERPHQGVCQDRSGWRGRKESRGCIHRGAEEPASLVQHTARRYADADAKRPGSSQAVLCELALDRLGAADRIRRPEKEGEYAVTSVLDLGPDMIGETTPQDLVVAGPRPGRGGHSPTRQTAQLH